MSYKFTIESKIGRIGGSNSNYNWILTERDAIMKAIFHNFILSEKLNDLVNRPDYLVYEYGEEKVYFKIEKQKSMYLFETLHIFYSK
jgi:hypothetical protein